jgi:1-acyl-sn-glycerol-3-phosphate acyltransferase
MQSIVFEKPYQFVPPHRGQWWFKFIRYFNFQGMYLRRHDGVIGYETRHLDRLKDSLAAGHGIMLTPNHARAADPLLMGWLSRDAGCLVYAMASWHLFNQGRFTAWAIRKMGGFSIYREGVDRQAINTAIQILESAERPLVIFPEGATSRTNDRLHALLDGVAFIARAAAKKRAKHTPPGKVVVHPIALKYLFGGDLKKAVDPVLTEIEQRLSWHPQRDLPLVDRINKVGRALLCLKELEYFGETQTGRLSERLRRLIDRLLVPLEEEWLGGAQEGPTVPRVKNLRMKILPDMVEGRISVEERQRRWRQLANIYLSQQVSSYPPDYLVKAPSVDRLLETVERYEEDLTDRVRVHGGLKVIMEVGQAIEVSPERDRKAAVDPVMQQIEQQLQSMLDKLSLESPTYEEAGDG